jgi:hypothetical protein
MAQVQAITCASCGASITIPGDLDRLNCAHCGTALTVVRGEGYIASRLADAVTRSIETTGAATQTELHRIQLRQEAVSVETQMAGLETEGRALRRTATSVVDRQQLAYLEDKYDDLVERLWAIQDALGVAHTHRLINPPVPPAEAAALAAASRTQRRVLWGFALLVLFCVVLLLWSLAS